MHEGLKRSIRDPLNTCWFPSGVAPSSHGLGWKSGSGTEPILNNYCLQRNRNTLYCYFITLEKMFLILQVQYKGVSYCIVFEHRPAGLGDRPPRISHFSKWQSPVATIVISKGRSQGTLWNKDEVRVDGWVNKTLNRDSCSFPMESQPAKPFIHICSKASCVVFTLLNISYCFIALLSLFMHPWCKRIVFWWIHKGLDRNTESSCWQRSYWWIQSVVAHGCIHPPLGQERELAVITTEELAFPDWENH